MAHERIYNVQIPYKFGWMSVFPRIEVVSVFHNLGAARRFEARMRKRFGDARIVYRESGVIGWVPLDDAS